MSAPPEDDVNVENLELTETNLDDTYGVEDGAATSAEENEEVDESSEDASSEHGNYFHSTWQHRLKKPHKIPRIPHDDAIELRTLLTKNRELNDLLLPNPDKDCLTHLGDFFTKYLSIFQWLPELLGRPDRNEVIKKDILAGLTVGVMAIPQSMSYADIAGLRYVYGMYAIFISCLVYGLTGNSRQLGVGPVAMVSLIVEAGLADVMSESECPAAFSELLEVDPTLCAQKFIDDYGGCEGLSQSQLCPGVYQKYVFTCSAIVGILNIVGGFLNLGFLVNFLAHPVVSGFTSGAAIIIGLSQVKYIVGYDIPKSQYVYESLGNLFADIGQLKPVVFIFGMTWILGLGFLGWGAKRPDWKYCKMLKPWGPLLVSVLGIAICGIFPALTDNHDVDIVKNIPEGFPPLSVGDWDFGKLSAVLGTAISASLIGYLESISIGKALAAKHDYKLNAGCEMVALGVTNFVGGMFSTYPVTGSFSRSAVNDATGAETQLAGLVTSAIMFLTLMLLTSWKCFYYLPKFALGAIVINSVKNLIAYDEAIHLWQVKRTDFIIWTTSFLGTLFLGIQLGIGIAVLISLMMLIHETVRPQMQILWRLPHTHVYSNIKTTTHGSFVPGVLTLRFMGSIYFGNCSYLKDKMDEIIDNIEDSKIDKIKYVVISLSACTSMDSSAIHAVKDIHKDLSHRNIKLAFAQVNNRVVKSMKSSHLFDYVGEEWFHETCHDAIQHCLSYNQEHLDEEKHFARNIEMPMDYEPTITIGAFGVQY